MSWDDLKIFFLLTGGWIVWGTYLVILSVVGYVALHFIIKFW